MPETIPVLFDTDIGSDIDDAVALAYLLRQPRCELLGVTTVTGDVQKRSALAQMLCEAAGQPEVPLHAGASEVLFDGPGQPDVPQYGPVKDLPHRLDWPANEAIEFMRRTIRERPGDVTLLSVGPLTNVALLFATDPELATLLKGWISMGGAFTERTRAKSDWNCMCDPLATALAFRGRVPRHTHVGLDVTLQCGMPALQVRESFQDPLLRLVLRMAEAWFSKRDEIVFHDPLATALVFNRDLCRYAQGTVTVDVGTGATSFERGGGRHEVALVVDRDAFFEEYFSVFS
jgi:purine nucleosidase